MFFIGLYFNTQIKKKWGGDSLQLRVNKKGMLLRREPRDTVVLNSDGSWVQGTLDLENIDQEYTASYHYINNIHFIPFQFNALVRVIFIITIIINHLKIRFFW